MAIISPPAPAVDAKSRPIWSDRIDAAALLTFYAVLLVAVPSDLRVPALGGAGGPPALWALGLGLLWCWARLHGDEHPDLGRRPPTLGLIAFALLGSTLVSYLLAMSGPISQTELNGADIGIIRMVSMLAVLLTAAYDLTDSPRFDLLLQRLCWVGAALATLGLLQFVTGRALVDSISIPGLVSTQPYSAVVDRGGYVRPAGTAMSPLEYGTALSAVLPIALTYAIYDQRRGPLARWAPAALIAAALLTSGSRSALVGLALGVLVMFPSWSHAIKVRIALLGLAAAAALLVVTPGLIGTLRYLFTNTANDPSARSRSGSYELVERFVNTSPIFGRGFGTFLPQYRILDNQYLLLLVELGLVGVVVFVALVLTAALSALAAGRRAPAGMGGQLGSALGASMLSTGVLAAFFDAFSFPMAAGWLFLIAGLCAAYVRLLASPTGLIGISVTSTRVRS